MNPHTVLTIAGWVVLGFGAGVLFTGILIASTGPKISGRWDEKRSSKEFDPYFCSFRIDENGKAWIRANEYYDWQPAEWKG